MADIYRVKLSDGRTVRVQSDSGPPSEDAILAQLSSSTTAPPTAPPAGAPPPDDGSFKFQPGESTGHAMLRYGGNELLGAARSPLDLVKNLFHMPGAIWKGYTQDIPTLLSDPSLLTELPGVAGDAASYLAQHPEELGSQLGQAVIGAKAVPAVAKITPSNIGSAASTFGRFVEGAGGDIATHGVLKGLSKAAVAPLAEKIGRGFQRAGGALEGKTPVVPGESLPTYPRLTKTKAPAAPTPVPQPGESLPGYPRVTETEAQPAPTPVLQPGESLPGYPRVTETEAQPAPTPVLQPGESLPGYPRVTETEAPAAPTPVPQPGESLPGYPRVTETEVPAAPTPVLQPGESLPGYPRGTVTPPPSIVETLTQRSGAPRAVARPVNLTENLQSRVAQEAAPEVTPEIAAPPEEGWITPAETLQSVGAPAPTGGRGFWSGLRRGDLWPQLQEEMLSTAEGPASSAAPPKSPGRTGPGAQGKGGRFAPKATAAPAADVAPAQPVETPPPEPTPAARKSTTKKPAAKTEWPWKFDEATGEWIETRPPVTSAQQGLVNDVRSTALKGRKPTTPAATESPSFEPAPPTQQEYIVQATDAYKRAKLPIPPEVAAGTRSMSFDEIDELALALGDKHAHRIPVDWQ